MSNKPASPAAAASPKAESDLTSLTPEPQRDQALAVPEAAAAPPALDAHGFDPAEYKWVPVRRRPRKDGWTPQRQKDFIAALAETGCVEHAAMKVQMSEASCYRLRRSPGAEGFSAAWDVALQHAARRLLDVAFDRAFRGTTEPVFDRDGFRVGTRFRQNDRLLMFLLRAYMPERFRHAHRDAYAADEALPPSALDAAPMAEVLRRLEPVVPPEPHRLMPPEELEDALLIADALPAGQLPRWQRGKGDAEPAPAPDVALEAELERLKHDDGEPATSAPPPRAGRRTKRALG
jgi:hypothetical protein